MRNLSRFQMLLGAMLLAGVVVSWPFMRRLRAIDRCLTGGNVWDYSAHSCVPPVNPHPVPDSGVRRRIVPRHQ